MKNISPLKTKFKKYLHRSTIGALLLILFSEIKTVREITDWLFNFIGNFILLVKWLINFFISKHLHK